jgi:drug/metabolite transporter (DMT)-like permease
MSSSQTKGIVLIIFTTLVFASQDGITKYLVEQYHVFSVTMIRYWAFAVFVIVVSMMQKGGIRQVARTRMLKLQLARGVILALQVCAAAYLFANLGLVNTHVIFACYPLMVTLFSIPLLGERVGIWRISAVICGFLGVIVILQPGAAVLDLTALLTLLSAAIFALYNIMTRYVARVDNGETSFFWTGVGGFLTMTVIGPFFWDPLRSEDIYWMAVLCVMGALGHYLMIKALEAAEASVLQPFTFLQLVFASLIGVMLFGETLTVHSVFGATIIVASGLFVIWRERLKISK